MVHCPRKLKLFKLNNFLAGSGNYMILPEEYSDPCQKSKIERFMKRDNG